MTQPATTLPAQEQIRRRRAADEILIAAIFGLSEHEDFDDLPSAALPPRTDRAAPVATLRAGRG